MAVRHDVINGYRCTHARAVVLDAYTKHFPLHELEPIFKAIDAVKKKDIEAREVAKRLAKKGTKPAETARPTSTTEGE